MTSQEKLIGLHQIADHLHQHPSMANLTKAQTLADSLANDDAEFWNDLFDFLSQDQTYRARAESLMLELGMDSAAFSLAGVTSN